MTSSDRIEALGAVLAAEVDWWKPRPFVAGPLPWAERAPEAARWLEALDHAAIDAIEGAGRLPADAPEVLRSLERTLAPLVAMPARASDPDAGLAQAQLDRREAAYVPGRKRAQIEGLAASVQARGPIVDWCGGKGHLGRTLGARARQPVTVIERDARFGDEARALAARVDTRLVFVAADVLVDAGVDEHLRAGVWAVGLHACGALGVRLLERAVGRGCEAIVLAPCCYHKDRWRALSAVGARSDPGIDHSALRLATSDEVVAPPRLRTARRRENAWRLGLDLLLREASGRDVYNALGTLPAALLGLPFEDFCREVAALCGLVLPTRWDAALVEAEAHRRALRARALGLARGLFRRTLETWVVLDRAEYLTERGLVVDVYTFCPRSVTPRNLLIDARRSSPSQSGGRSRAS